MLELFYSPLHLTSGATVKPLMRTIQRRVDFAYPKVGPVGILSCPLSGSRVAENPNVTNGRNGSTTASTLAIIVERFAAFPWQASS